MGWDCVWKDMAQGPGTQCMRLAVAGQAEVGEGKPDEIGEMRGGLRRLLLQASARHGQRRAGSRRSVRNMAAGSVSEDRYMLKV